MYNLPVNQLTQFGLKKNHIKLVNFFLQNLGKELSAREISTQVNIPVSRIYVYLNDLVKLSLLDRKFQNKSVFVLTEPESRFREFLIKKDVEIKELQKNILGSLREFAAQDFIIFKSLDEFYESAYSMAKDVHIVKILSHNPFLIFNQESAWGKQLFDMYRHGIENKDMKFSYVFDKNFLKSKGLVKNLDAMAENLKWLNSFDNVELRVVDGKNILPLLTLIITNKEVLVGFSNPDEIRVAKGLLLRSEEMANFFERIYEQVYKKSKKVDMKSINALSTSLGLLKKFSLRLKRGPK